MSKRPRQASTSSKSHSTSDSKDEPPRKIKKVKSVPTPTTPQPTPHPPTPITLGSLPLYGEQLPEGGYEAIPPAASHTCTQLKEVIDRVRELKETQGSKAEIEAQKHRGLVFFATLKRLNRLSHLFCKDAREQTHEQKLEVDDLHLQLQNLMYEAMHLRKEITNCLEFKSQHEDIDLVSEEEFYASAPAAISRPGETKEDEHQRMLCRLEWELEQRKQLATQQGTLEGEIQVREAEIGRQEERLGSLQPALEGLRRATLPLQELLGLPLDRLREEHRLAMLLPPPLYIVYMQARAYAEVEDESLAVCIAGDGDEARAFQTTVQREPSDDESDSDTDGGKESRSRRKKRRKTGKGSSKEQKEVSKAHPLTIILTLSPKDLGTVKITLSYLPNFTAVCASVTSITVEGISENQLSSFLEKSAFLHCLFEGDTGRTSPHSVVSFHIRKQGGDVFSSAVRQYGFPYKWVQRVCGVSFPAENPECTAIQPQADVSRECIVGVVRALKTRFTAQVFLTKQILSLEERMLLLGGSDVLFPHSPQSQFTRWKSVSLQEVQTMQFGSLAIFNLQERTNRFFVATFQLKQVRLHGLVCVGTDYPATPPCFVIMVESAGQREPHGIHTKNLEADVNIHFPRSLEGDGQGQYLLCRQIRRLQECFDMYLEYKNSPSELRSKPPHWIRGKGRLLDFSDSP